MVKREIEKTILGDLFQGKAIILTGPRRVGKTTLLNQIAADANRKVLLLNCDEPDVRQKLTNVTSTALKALIGDYELVMIDEAQRVKNIGLTLKLITDNIKKVQVIATGSSALELANEINEPLTGRKREYHLFPFSFGEMAAELSLTEETRLLQQRLIFGYYPEVVTNPSKAQVELIGISNDYLYKDVLSLQDIRKPALLEKILLALSLQIGSEVSYNELAQATGTDSKTVERYIDLLEKCFVIFQLRAFSRNMRNEIKKGKKIYFFDNGIRNAVLNNFSPIGSRPDKGALWENFLVSERMKANLYGGKYVKSYFWRTTSQQEIDLIEEAGGHLEVFEFKWSEKSKAKIPASFTDNYQNVTQHIIHNQNFPEFLKK